MKKSALLVLGVCLALSLVLANFQPASAYDLPAPSVTPVSGDREFTATPTAISKLPGILPNDNGIILPAGFPSGTAQFMGEGMLVSGFSGGTATLCFPVPAAQSEWVGTIHEWIDGKWTRLTTSVTQGNAEDTLAMACTTIYGDGTYAMIMGFTGQPQPKGLPQCSADLKISGWSYGMVSPEFPGNTSGKTMSMIMNISLNTPLPPGTSVTYSIININPPGSITGALTRAGGVVSVDAMNSNIQFVEMTFDWDLTQPVWLYTDTGLSDLDFTLRLTLPDCYKDFQNPFASNFQ